MAVPLVTQVGLIIIQFILVTWFLYAAYKIRLYAIEDFGYVIHEFDPWFNFRATEYLAEHGLSKFFTWYDHMSWYPLGRPIGTTIFPGMQMTGVAIWHAMKAISSFLSGGVENAVHIYDVPAVVAGSINGLVSYLHGMGLPYPPMIPAKIRFVEMTLNDICCLMPAWYGSIASLFTGLLAYEISRSVNAGVIAVGIMAVLPAHLMRSIAGEFDNEAVAMAAICSTFWLWLRSVRTPKSWPFGVLAGISYTYMVLCWGGYIFVLNMIGVHAFMLVWLGRFNSGIYKAYSLFFAIGTFGAIQVPVVGWQPLRSFEQMGPLLVFLGYQVLAFCDAWRHRKKLTTRQFILFRASVSACFLVSLLVAALMLWPTGYFGPLSSRIRGLFVKHTKTGNPLVDSVAEHQPASKQSLDKLLNLPYEYQLAGTVVCLVNRTNGCYFMHLWSFVTSYFAGKMARLILMCAPIVSIACAVWCGFLLDFIYQPFLLSLGKMGYCPAFSFKSSSEEEMPQESRKTAKTKGASSTKVNINKKSSQEPQVTVALGEWEEKERLGGISQVFRTAQVEVLKAMPSKEYCDLRKFLDSNSKALGVRAGFSFLLVMYICYFSDVGPKVQRFLADADMYGRQLANPRIIKKAKLKDGRVLLIDDYYKGYLWIEANTPKDARVMAWWDYGYQITGIAKRTTIADGNTWNHEHIATLGRTLTSPQKVAWKTIRHLADYVLVWAGGGGDDLAKSPHLARIGNSVFPDHCGDGDPKCVKFGFTRGQNGNDRPTPMMAESLLYNLVQNELEPGAVADPELFQEVHRTKYGLMRIYKVMNVSTESKEWIANPANRLCDAPGSWYCVGQYPPALDELIRSRRSFSQVEDFNKKGGKSAYTKLIEKELRGEL